MVMPIRRESLFSIYLDDNKYVNISYNVGDNRSYFVRLHLDIIKISLYNKNNIDNILQKISKSKVDLVISVGLSFRIKKKLIDQIFSTVKWRESIIFMEKSGVKNFIEIGPGKTLCGMVKRTVKDVNCFPINSIVDIKNLLNEFKK
mgnify:CR=1 FL=1